MNDRPAPTLDEIIRTYDTVARTYAGKAPHEEDPGLREACRRLFRGRLKGNRVLEIGCGPGTDSQALHVAGLDVLATDFCGEFVEIVRERYPHLKARQMDMLRPDLEPRSFDGIYGFASFLHLPRELAPDCLVRLRELLDDEGVLFLHLAQSTKLREYVLDDWILPGHRMLFTCYSPDEITELLTAAGFSTVERHAIRSEFYEKIPRLIERGVTGYQVTAHH